MGESVGALEFCLVIWSMTDLAWKMNVLTHVFFSLFQGFTWRISLDSKRLFSCSCATPCSSACIHWESRGNCCVFSRPPAKRGRRDDGLIPCPTNSTFPSPSSSSSCSSCSRICPYFRNCISTCSLKGKKSCRQL